jgi:hypothetical protein
MKIEVRNIYDLPENEQQRIVSGKYIAKIYIGRGSPLGNKHKITKMVSREQSIAMFSKDLAEAISKGEGELYDAVVDLYIAAKEFNELELFCYCAPKICHGDVLKKCILWMDKNGGKTSK